MIQEKIQEIINRRKPLALRLENVHERFTQAMTQFERFRSLCAKKMQDKNLAEDLSRINASLSESGQLSEEGNYIRDKLFRLSSRLSRDTLNIAVIGRARQGKSRLLQSITGLSSDEIPDGSLEFCTGVRSDIVNDPDAEQAYAIVYFLSERRFLDEKVLLYFEALREYKKDLVIPVSMAEFRNMILPSISEFNASHVDLPAIELHLKHLEELQSKECLDQYVQYIGQSPRHIRKEEIREYVAQDDREGRRVYFKHLAVDKVEIFCKFPKADTGALRLIDLPGLGDTHLGDIQRVARALKDQVDFIFFLRKPENLGAGWEDKDIQLYTEARRALSSDLPVSEWSFWVFNHVSQHGADNLQQCEQLQRKINDVKIEVSDTIIADCADPEDVSVKLIDKALNFLADNMEHNDNIYCKNIQGTLYSLMEKVSVILKNIESLLKDDYEFDKDSGKFDDLFSKLWSVLRRNVQNFVGRNSVLRKEKDNDCEDFKAKIESILDEEDSKGSKELHITEDEIADIESELGGINSAYESCMHQLRTGLSERMETDLDETLNTVLIRMKDNLCSILGSHEIGRLSEYFGTSDHELAHKVVTFIINSGYEHDMQDLLRGMKLLSDWKMNYRSFLQHRLRKCLNDLDPLDQEAMSALGTPSNPSEASEQLLALYKQAIANLREEFKVMYPEPNRASFAVAEEFKDIMIRSGGEGRVLENQWRQFYRSIRGKIWSDVYGISQNKREAYAELRSHLHVLIPLCEPSQFIFHSVSNNEH